MERTLIDLTWPKEKLIELSSEACYRCGRCCYNPLVLEEEIDKIKGYLKERKDKFPNEPDSYFIRKIFANVPDIPFYRIRLKGNECSFLSRDEDGKAACEIQEVKPLRCSTYSHAYKGSDVWFYYQVFVSKEKDPEKRKKHLEWLAVNYEKIPVRKDGELFLLEDFKPKKKDRISFFEQMLQLFSR